MEEITCQHCGRTVYPSLGAVLLDFVVIHAGNHGVETSDFVDIHGNLYEQPAFVMSCSEEDVTDAGLDFGDSDDDEIFLCDCWEEMFEEYMEDDSDRPPVSMPNALYECDWCCSSLIDGQPCVRVRRGTVEERKQGLSFDIAAGTTELVCPDCIGKFNELHGLWARDILFMLTDG